MSLKDVTAGRYNARAVKGAWGKSKEKGTPMVAVYFEFMNGSQKEGIWWTGYLTQTPNKDGSTVAERTFETLSRIGYNDNLPLSNDANGNPVFGPSHLADKEMSIVIEIEDYNGKPQHRVRWVNELGGSAVAGMPVEAVLGAMNLKAEMAAARARLGTPKPMAQAQTIQKPTFDEDQIPF